MTDPLDAALAGKLRVGGEITVNRLGFGAMRIIGRGARGEPTDPGAAHRVLRRFAAEFTSGAAGDVTGLRGADRREP